VARVLIVYHRAPGMMWRSTYASHMGCFERFSGHDVYYLNTSWPKVPRYLRNLKPDLVILHYTFLATRWTKLQFEEHFERILFLKDVMCPKALIPHDEHIYTDRLCDVVNTLGVTNIFTPALQAQWQQIYAGVDFSKITFTNVLTGYLDEETVSKTARRARRHNGRPIDVGYRSWAVYPNFGRHSRLKGEIGRRFQDRAPEFGLVTDISSSAKDALLGDKWFDFLLDCKYTIGVEGGASILDRDGSARESVIEYQAAHADASFEEIEHACFPGRDGELDYKLLGPRHFEAVMTQTCQVLIEGTYGGVLRAGEHYIALEEDFGNLDQVLEIMKSDRGRVDMVERAYRDIVESGDWTYKALADLVFRECLGSLEPVRASTEARRTLQNVRWGLSAVAHAVRRVYFSFTGSLRYWRYRLWAYVRAGWGRIYWIVRLASERLWYRLTGWVAGGLAGMRVRGVRGVVTDMIVTGVGEERVWRATIGLKNAIRRLRGGAPLAHGEYVPSEAEVERRAKRATRRDGST